LLFLFRVAKLRIIAGKKQNTEKIEADKDLSLSQHGAN
jgi:hypothetical protein